MAGSEDSRSLGAGSAGSFFMQYTRQTSVHSNDFEPTPATVAAAALERTIKHWNTPRTASKIRCCKFHAQLDVAEGLVRTMRTGLACKPTFHTHTSWQCGKCKCVNTDDHFECPHCSADLDGDS